MKKWIAVAVVLSLVLAGTVLAQAPQAGTKPGAPAASRAMNITGKIAKTEQGYIIQGQEPAELFTILNPNSHVLDRLVKSGRSVNIEAVSILGDNVNILKINGKTYREAEPGTPKGK